MGRDFQALRSSKNAFLFLALGIALIVINVILIKQNSELRTYLNQRAPDYFVMVMRPDDWKIKAMAKAY